MNKLPLHKRVQILSMLVEGSSMRSISRVVGVSINTVTKLLVARLDLPGYAAMGTRVLIGTHSYAPTATRLNFKLRHYPGESPSLINRVNVLE